MKKWAQTDQLRVTEPVNVDLDTQGGRLREFMLATWMKNMKFYKKKKKSTNLEY